MVGDGMGPSFNTAYRYYKNKPGAKKMTPTAFDKYLKGTNRTYSNDLKKMLQTLLLEEQLLVPVTKHITVRLVLIQIKPIKSVLEQAKRTRKINWFSNYC